MKRDGTDYKLTGKVVSLSAKGQGANSEILLVSVKPPAGDNVALAIYSDAEPGLVAAYATMLMAAFTLKDDMDFYYNFDDGDDQPGEIFQIVYPAGSQ